MNKILFKLYKHEQIFFFQNMLHTEWIHCMIQLGTSIYRWFLFQAFSQLLIPYLLWWPPRSPEIRGWILHWLSPGACGSQRCRRRSWSPLASPTMCARWLCKLITIQNIKPLSTQLQNIWQRCSSMVTLDLENTPRGH